MTVTVALNGFGRNSVHGPFRGEVKVEGDTFDAGYGPTICAASRKAL